MRAEEHDLVWPDFEVIQSQQLDEEVKATSERLLDLESAEQTAVCQVCGVVTKSGMGTKA